MQRLGEMVGKAPRLLRVVERVDGRTVCQPGGKLCQPPINDRVVATRWQRSFVHKRSR